MNKINRRSQLREAAFLILFRNDFHTDEDFKEQIEDFFEGEECFTEKEKEIICAKVTGTVSKLNEIDNILNEVSIGWKTRRMTKVDLTALRLACYEIQYDDSVPTAAAINEAVELVKNYGMESSGSFVNGILAKVVKKISDPQEQITDEMEERVSSDESCDNETENS